MTSTTVWRGALFVPTKVSRALTTATESRSGLSKRAVIVHHGALRRLCRGSGHDEKESPEDTGCGRPAPQAFKRMPQSTTSSGLAWGVGVGTATDARITSARLRPGDKGGRGLRWMSTTGMSEAEFHAVADEELEGIQDAVEIALEEGFDEEFDCNLSQGVLNIIVGDRGTWVLNKQSPNRQIWWSSPTSGPMRFEYDADSQRWVNTRDGNTELRSILALEMKEECGVDLADASGS
ncbi:unnamed protein product [Ascophyllum nodosum]